MKKQIGIFLLSLVASATMAQTKDSLSTEVQPVAKVVTQPKEDVTFAMIDSIRSHATALYASKVLNGNGYKLAYGQDVDQKGWRKYHLHEVAFSNTAVYDEGKKAWKVRRNQLFSYIRLVYDGYSKRLCHYQVMFATQKGFKRFQKDALDNGYVYKKKIRNKEEKGVKSTYYNAKTDCYMIFSEFEDGQRVVDLWQGRTMLGD